MQYFFLHPSRIPKDEKITCIKLDVKIRPLKAETHRVRATMGGDRLEHEGSISTVPATMTIVKIHLNSTISKLSDRYMTLNIKDFY